MIMLYAYICIETSIGKIAGQLFSGQNFLSAALDGAERLLQNRG